jgi:hypothetical protein
VISLTLPPLHRRPDILANENWNKPPRLPSDGAQAAAPDSGVRGRRQLLKLRHVLTNGTIILTRRSNECGGYGLGVCGARASSITHQIGFDRS